MSAKKYGYANAIMVYIFFVNALSYVLTININISDMLLFLQLSILRSLNPYFIGVSPVTLHAIRTPIVGMNINDTSRINANVGKEYAIKEIIIDDVNATSKVIAIPHIIPRTPKYIGVRYI